MLELDKPEAGFQANIDSVKPIVVAPEIPEEPEPALPKQPELPPLQR